MENKIFRILLADDDEGDRLLFKEAIVELKIKNTVQTVNDGLQLMDYLTKEGSVLPHLIFLDLNMPRKNGLECLKEIRGNEKFKKVSIAVYSTSAAEKDINETFHGGANVYIKKPNNFGKLKQLLHKAITTSNLYQDESFDIENFVLSI